MQPEGSQEITTPSPEVTHIEIGQNQQVEIESTSNTFSVASQNLKMELDSILGSNPDVDFSQEQKEMTELSTQLSSISHNFEGDDWPTLDISDRESKNVSEKSSLQFKSKNLSIVHGLIEGGAITSEPSQEPGHSWTRDYTVDDDKAKKILGETEWYEAHGPTSDVEKQELRNEAIQVYPDIIRSFKDAGVLTEELEVQLGRLLKAENISIEDIEMHHFYYSGDSFPESQDKEPALRLGTGQQKHMEQRLSDALSSIGVSLDHEKVRRVALQWGLSHETGHAVDRAMRLKAYEDVKKTDAEINMMHEQIQVDSEMDSYIEDEVAPDVGLSKIKSLMGGDNRRRIGKWTHERVAGGFEYIGLTAALRDAGLNDAQIDQAIQHFKSVNDEFLDESTKAYDYLSKSGIKDYDLQMAIYELKKGFRENGESELASKLPDLNLSSLGYARPLTSEQTRSFIEKYSKS